MSALLKNGDAITIDADQRELSARRKAWQKPALRYTRGVLYKYAALVSSASEGAVTGF